MKQVESLAAQRTVGSWCATKPELSSLFNAFNRNDIAWGIFSNAARQLLARCVSADTLRINDLDILVPEEQFEQAAELVPSAKVSTKMVDITSRDGSRLTYVADEITANVGTVPIQIMRSPTGMNRDGYHAYRLDMTELAAEHRLAVPMDEATAYFAHSFDTVGAKAMLQRAAPKQDFDDAAHLVRWGNLDQEVHEQYIQRRAAEMCLDERACQFIGRAGLHVEMELSLA